MGNELPFARIRIDENKTIFNSGASRTAMAVYNVMRATGDYASATYSKGNEKIRQELGMKDKRAIKRAVNQLEMLGLIQMISKPHGTTPTGWLLVPARGDIRGTSNNLEGTVEAPLRGDSCGTTEGTAMVPLRGDSFDPPLQESKEYKESSTQLFSEEITEKIINLTKRLAPADYQQQEIFNTLSGNSLVTEKNAVKFVSDKVSRAKTLAILLSWLADTPPKVFVLPDLPKAQHIEEVPRGLSKERKEANRAFLDNLVAQRV